MITGDSRHLTEMLSYKTAMLFGMCQRWLVAWAALPDRLSETKKLVCGRLEDRQRGVKGSSQNVLILIESISRDYHKGSLLPDKIQSFAEELEKLEMEELMQPSWDEPGSIYSALHRLKSLILVVSGLPAIKASADASMKARPEEVNLEDVETMENLVQALEASDVEKIRAASQALGGSIEGAHPKAREAEYSPDAPVGATDWLVISVEDLPEVRSMISHTVKLIAEHLCPPYTIQYEEYGDRQTATRRLEEAKKQSKGEGRIHPLLILDLGIPENQGELPSHNAGRQLLKHARKILNIPVVILTMPHNFLRDHLLAAGMGISDYILKGPDSEKRLSKSIISIVTQPVRHSYRVLSDKSTVIIDGLEIRLDPLPFAVFCKLAECPRTGLTLDDIERKVETQNGQDAIYKLRTAIKEGFDAAQKSIDPQQELLIWTAEDEQPVYKLVGEQIRSGAETPAEPQNRVLVVEDEPTMLEEVKSLLQEHGYQVATAADGEQAVTVADAFQPAILCLDLCIPPKAGKDPDPLEGLRVLERIKESQRALRAVALTNLAQYDQLRQRAGDSGIRPDDFVEKRLDPAERWKTEIVLRVWRVEQELRRRVALPLPASFDLPFVELKQAPDGKGGTTVTRVRVFGKGQQHTPRERKLLALLAADAGRTVSSDDLIYGLWPGSGPENPDVQLRQVVYMLRKHIYQHWFGIPEEDREAGMNLANAVLANSGKRGYVLNARVEIV